MEGEVESRGVSDTGKRIGGEAGLSARQVQILTLVAQGQTYQQVAETIGIAERTVKYHMAEILERLHLDNRAQVIAYAARLGMTGEPGEW